MTGEQKRSNEQEERGRGRPACHPTILAAAVLSPAKYPADVLGPKQALPLRRHYSLQLPASTIPLPVPWSLLPAFAFELSAGQEQFVSWAATHLPTIGHLRIAVARWTIPQPARHR